MSRLHIKMPLNHRVRVRVSLNQYSIIVALAFIGFD